MTQTIKAKPLRYVVTFRPSFEEEGLYYNNNYVSYSVEMDRLKYGSALSHALYASRTYNGQITIEMNDGSTKLYKPEKSR